MPIRRSIGRALGAALFTASLLLTVMPASSLALDPPRPLPGYRPVFVTERQPGPWEDCAWAAASMLLDKWTNGITTVGRDELRSLSRDRTGGSSFADIERAFSRLGLGFRWSPSGGDRITWPRLLDRLGRGSGAIVFGDYGKLPRRYGRWDPTFWQRTGVLDDHALYFDAFDRTRNRILVMDPMAPPGWGGEWIPVSALKEFAWRSGSSLWAATTPTAAKAPFDGVQLGAPSATGDAAALRVLWPVEQAPTGWIAPGFATAVLAEPLAEADPLATDVVAFPADPLVPPVAAAVTAATGRALEARIPLPTAPGIYRVTVAVTEQRFGREVATAGPFNVYIPGPRAWHLGLPGPQEVAPGSLTGISFVIANVGTESWAEPAAEPRPSVAGQRPMHTRLVGTWVGPAMSAADQRPADGPADIDFGQLALEPGYVQSIDSQVRVPIEGGTWHLMIRVVEDGDGSSAFAGSVPGIMVFDVRAQDATVAQP